MKLPKCPLLWSWILFAACGSPDPGADPRACSSHADCPADFPMCFRVTTGGRCLPCGDGFSCPGTQTCIDSWVCREITRCTSDDMCPTGMCDTTPGHGYCIECRSASDCGPDELCSYGECVTAPACGPSSWPCHDLDTRFKCDEVRGRCVECDESSGCNCQEGLCLPNVCEPGREVRCLFPDEYQICLRDGSGFGPSQFCPIDDGSVCVEGPEGMGIPCHVR